MFQQFYKKMKIFRKKRTLGTRIPLLEAFGPQKWEDLPPPSREKKGAGTRKSSRTRLVHPCPNPELMGVQIPDFGVVCVGGAAPIAPLQLRVTGRASVEIFIKPHDVNLNDK